MTEATIASATLLVMFIIGCLVASTEPPKLMWKDWQERKKDMGL